MGLYYTYCSRCNGDGSFNNVNPDCNKCDGRGKDYIDDTPDEKEHLLMQGEGMGKNGSDLELLYDSSVNSSSSSSNYTESSKNESSSVNWFMYIIIFGVLVWLFGK